MVPSWHEQVHLPDVTFPGIEASSKAVGTARFPHPPDPAEGSGAV